MDMTQDGIEVMMLPDAAHCKLDEQKRSPLDIEECQVGETCCTGDCIYYSEEEI